VWQEFLNTKNTILLQDMAEFTALGAILLIVGVIFVLLYIGISLLYAEVRTPGLFFTTPGAVLITLGIIALFIPDAFASLLSVIIAAIVAFLTIVITLYVYLKLVPPEVPETTVATSIKGRTGVVTKEVLPDSISGKVKIGSQIWSATSSKSIPSGKKVKVVNSDGVHVVVEELE
jgi:membrane protein implicated in regulation of membrane protease activity